MISCSMCGMPTTNANGLCSGICRAAAIALGEAILEPLEDDDE